MNDLSSLDAEKLFFSAVFLDEGVFDLYASSGFGPTVFEQRFSQALAATISELQTKGKSIDLATVYTAIDAHEDIPNALPLLEYNGLVETTMHAKNHFRLVVESYRMRSLREKSQKLAVLAESKLWDDIKDKVSAIGTDLADTTEQEEARSQKEALKQVIDDRKRLMEGKEPLNSKPIKTGIPCVDRFLRPFDTATSDFNNILFAQQGTGKSSLMSMIVSENVRSGKKAAVFLGETNREGLYAQMCSQITRCAMDGHDFQKEPSDRQRSFVAMLEQMENALDERLWVYDDDFYIESIISRCNALHRKGVDLDLIVIDHLHCCHSKRDFKTTREEFNYLSGCIKPLGKSMNCPVLALAQPNRMFKSGDRPPKCSDLKETGNLEDDADRIWALWLPPKDDTGMEQDEFTPCPQVQLHQLKFKRGKTGRVNLRFEKKYTLFTDDTTKGQHQ